MHATTIFSVLAMASTAFAAPAPTTQTNDASTISARGAARPWWRITDYKRNCVGNVGAETSCTTTFAIETVLDKTPFACTVTTAGKAGDPATRASFSGVSCGPNGKFTFSSGWSGQFGNGNGFSTIAIVDNQEKVIVYAGYSDSEIPADGSAVKPNKQVQPHNL